MNATDVARTVEPPFGAGSVVGVDLAKDVLQVCVADGAWCVRESHRLTRAQFERFFLNRTVSLVVMEACGSAHHWGRWLNRLGIPVLLLHARYVRAYVRRNKTDAADAAALLQAARDNKLKPVRVKSVDQQALQALHRTRSLWKDDRTRRINTLRGFCREFGLVIATGARHGIEQIARLIAEPHSGLPPLLRPSMALLVEEIRLLEARIAQLERELAQLVRTSEACTTLLTIPGVGLLTATAMLAATAGDVTHFESARHFASWLGITPKEDSSGACRRLGRISKWGDTYLRMLLVHGARSVLRAAALAESQHKPLEGLRAWALNVQRRTNHNKAACALANKLARICFACLRDHAPYGQQAHVERKRQRQTFTLPTTCAA